jgi:hypothetical protein
MSDVLISALVQAPFVLVMVYLVHRFLQHLDKHDAEWRGFMDRADAMLADRLSDLTGSVERLADLLAAHDAAMRGSARREDHACADDADHVRIERRKRSRG